MDVENKLADTLLGFIREGLSLLGIPETVQRWMDVLVYVAAILTIAFVVAWVIRRLALHSVHRLLKRRRIHLLGALVEYDAIRRLSYVLPPLVAVWLLPLGYSNGTRWYEMLLHLAWIWFVVAVVRSVNVVLRSMAKVMLSREAMHDRPMKGFFQIVQVLVGFIGAVVVISILLGKSPITLITGLGAFAAVLMLVFKDSILGFVAGVLLAENDMIHIGDWIELPSAGVNGIVRDVTLTIVKVQNFDNTIVTVPPYTLISGSFVNWRGMKQSAGRRIMRTFLLVHDSIVTCSMEFLERMKAFDADLSEFIVQKLDQASRGIVVDTHNPEGLVDGSIETNVGLLRAYISLYLRRHQQVNATLDLMVRSLPPEPEGLPLQLYCFSSDKVWAEYESIQAGIVEHVISVLPIFGLQLYQRPSGRDFKVQIRE